MLRGAFGSAYEQDDREVCPACRSRIGSVLGRCAASARTVAEPAHTRNSSPAERRGKSEGASTEDGRRQARLFRNLARTDGKISRESRRGRHSSADDAVGPADLQAANAKQCDRSAKRE